MNHLYEVNHSPWTLERGPRDNSLFRTSLSSITPPVESDKLKLPLYLHSITIPRRSIYKIGSRTTTKTDVNEDCAHSNLAQPRVQLRHSLEVRRQENAHRG